MSIYIHKSCIWQAFQHNWFTWFSQLCTEIWKFLSIYWHYKTPNSPHTFLWLWILIVEKLISSVLRRYRPRIYRFSVRHGVKNRVNQNSKIVKINLKNLNKKLHINFDCKYSAFGNDEITFFKRKRAMWEKFKYYGYQRFDYLAFLICHINWY